MLSIDIKFDTKQVEKHLKKVQKQIPYATAVALTKTAKDIQKEEAREMGKVFDRPTRYTLNSIYIVPATKKRLIAEIKIKDEAYKGNKAAKYLSAEVKGGGREHKGFEKLLIARGMMPHNMYAVPSRTMKLNSFGNVTQGMIQKILSGLGSQRDIYQNARYGSKTYGKYFSGIINGTHGVWDINKLRKGGPALLFLFVRRPTYKKQFKFYNVARRTFERMFEARFNAELRRALATAK